MTASYAPEDWGLSVAASGELLLDGQRLTALAKQYGTPLHVMSARRLRETAKDFVDCARAGYPGKASVHFALKCNQVPRVGEEIRKTGLNVEVASDYELHLALRLGFEPSRIMANGPAKSSAFLERCVREKIWLTVVDSLDELERLGRTAGSGDEEVAILLRVNPGYVPDGMNQGAASASRHNSFGLDLKGGEIQTALRRLRGGAGPYARVRFKGFHMHIGTGIRSPEAYTGALKCLPLLRSLCRETGHEIAVVDVGGGVASRTTRLMSTMEMALYETLGLLPRFRPKREMPPLRSFLAEIGASVGRAFQGAALPELVFEPGRCIASPNQCLLLSVLDVKRRPGIKTWIGTDGGLSTVTMPTYYECHEVLLCNDVRRPRSQTVTLNGPACFSGDAIYKNIRMPRVDVGEVLAVMDTGAYFSSLESTFGFPRPAIVLVDDGEARVIRSRETYDEMVARDAFGSPS